jgi:hypothetical protein
LINFCPNFIMSLCLLIWGLAYSCFSRSFN